MTTALVTWFRPQQGDETERTANRLFHIAILTALGEGVRRRDPSVIVNGVVSLVFAAIPGFFENRYGARFRPWQRLWVSAAALVHTSGLLGPYDRIWWWDHLAHALSGAVVAGAADVVLRVGVEEAGRATVSPTSRPVVVVGVTLAFGSLWEALEYVVHAIADRLGFEPLLVHYGRLDTVRDVVFDLLGAGLVVLFGRRALSNVVESITDEGAPAGNSRT